MPKTLLDIFLESYFDDEDQPREAGDVLKSMVERLKEEWRPEESPSDKLN